MTSDPAYDYGCLMLGLSSSPTTKVSPEDLYEPENPQYGEEDFPHVTLRYGFDASVASSDALDALRGYCRERGVRSAFLLSGPTHFAQQDYDVLKYDVVDDDGWLRGLNERLRELPGTTTHFEYRPHVTVAYLLPGKAIKYVDDRVASAVAGELVYSKPDGTKQVTSLKALPRDCRKMPA